MMRQVLLFLSHNDALNSKNCFQRVGTNNKRISLRL
jgi:hypothetical protein